MIKATIIADSLNIATEDRLTTFVLVYPRFIHSELMTHRLFTRNAASSRAIPVERMISEVKDNPAVPVEWGTTQKGMQAGPPLPPAKAAIAEMVWRDGVDYAIMTAQALLRCDVHKQIANRVLEPWAHMTTLVSATEFGNFFRLRAHPEAQPEFQELAYAMLGEYIASEPVERKPGEWHLPFGDRMPDGFTIEQRIKVSVARSARLSYQTFDGEIDPEKDFLMYDRLRSSGHWSPFEHPAQAIHPMTTRTFNRHVAPGYWLGNFRGWKQHRLDVEPQGQQSKLTKDELRAIYDLRPNRGEV